MINVKNITFRVKCQNIELKSVLQNDNTSKFRAYYNRKLLKKNIKVDENDLYQAA